MASIFDKASDRRTVLKTGGAVCAGLALCATLPGRVFAQAFATNDQQRQILDVARREADRAGKVLWRRDIVGVADFGRFAFITGAAQAIATIVGFQTWQIVVRYGVDHVNSGDEAALARLLRLCVLLDASCAVIGGLVSAAILLMWGDSFGISRDLMVATLGFVFVELITIRSSPVGMLRLRDKFSLAALADSTTPMVRFLGAIAAWLLLPTVTGFLIAWAIAEIATSGAYWIMVLRTGDLGLVFRGRMRSGWRSSTPSSRRCSSSSTCPAWRWRSCRTARW